MKIHGHAVQVQVGLRQSTAKPSVAFDALLSDGQKAPSSQRGGRQDQAVGFDATGVFGRRVAMNDEARTPAAAPDMELLRSTLTMPVSGADQTEIGAGLQRVPRFAVVQAGSDARLNKSGLIVQIETPPGSSPEVEQTIERTAANKAEAIFQGVDDAVETQSIHSAEQILPLAVLDRHRRTVVNLRLEMSSKDKAVAVIIGAPDLTEAELYVLQQRAEALAAHHGLTLETVRINGRDQGRSVLTEEHFSWR